MRPGGGEGESTPSRTGVNQLTLFYMRDVGKNLGRRAKKRRPPDDRPGHMWRGRCVVVLYYVELDYVMACPGTGHVGLATADYGVSVLAL